MPKFQLDMFLAPNYPNDDEFINGFKVTLDPRKAIFRVMYQNDVTWTEEGQEMNDIDVKEMEIITGSSDTFQFVRLGHLFERMLMPLCKEHFCIISGSTRLQPIIE